ncbi:organic cation/carnitine transporter 7-like [Chrysoperla carnea]|uniref:organic cation/carnitine transporter 7-like n=1 Tax=Chrysoperla carnea TaxID=189513 RepID=UPI001D075D71|nr:organic cation/carnitine transporter 7-like [Chrysoperla carnea]
MHNKQIFTIEKGDHLSHVLGQYSFEDAIAETGFGKYNIVLVIMSGLGILGVITESIALGMIIPSAQCDLQLTTTMKGVLTTILVAGILVASQPWGYLGDTRGRRSTMIVPTFFSVIVSIIASMAVDFYWMVVLRFISGLLVSSSASIIYAYVSEFHGLNHRPAVLTFTSSFVALASITVPAMAWIILPMDWSFDISSLGITYRPWRLLIILFSLPNLLFVCLLLCFPESPRFLVQINKSEEALNILRNIFTWNTGQDKNMFPVRNIINKEGFTTTKDPKSSCLTNFSKQLTPLFLPPFWTKTLLICSIQFGSFYAGLGVVNWIPQILNEFYSVNYPTSICEVFNNKSRIIHGNFTENEDICIDTVNTTMLQTSFSFGLVMYIVYLCVACLVKIVGNKRILILLFTISGLACCFMHNIKNYWVTTFLFGIFILNGITVGLTNSFTPDMYPTKYRAMAISVSFMIGRIGSVTGSNVMGFMLDYNCNVAFYTPGVILLGCALISFLLPSSSRKE